MHTCSRRTARHALAGSHTTVITCAMDDQFAGPNSCTSWISRASSCAPKIQIRHSVRRAEGSVGELWDAITLYPSIEHTSMFVGFKKAQIRLEEGCAHNKRSSASLPTLGWGGQLGWLVPPRASRCFAAAFYNCC